MCNQKVFVVFNEEASQQRCLTALCVGAVPALLDMAQDRDPKHVFRGNVLAVREAPEVSVQVFYFQCSKSLSL